MRAVVTGDLHFSLYGSDPIVENDLHERLYYIDKVFRGSILQYAIDNQIDNCIVAGDIFHNKSIIHSLAMATFVNVIRDFPGIHFYLIDGNHDHSKMSGDGVSALKSLSRELNVTVIHNTLEIENIYMVAWNYKMIKNVTTHKKCDYLISHFGLNEASLSSGISIVSDLGMKDLKQYNHVLLGHYHKPQEIVKGNTTLYYVGSPIQLDMGEKNEDKRFLDVNFETHEILSISTEGYKKFYQFKIDETTDVNEVIVEAKKLKDEGHVVSLEILTNTELDVDDGEFRIIDKRDVDITNRGITSDMDEAAKLKAYCEIKEIPEDDMEYYISAGIHIINSVTT